MYATLDDMISRFGTTELVQLSDHDGLYVINQAVVEAAITDACHVIDSYVAKVHTLPLPETPHMLLRHACNISRFYLYSKGMVPESVKDFHDQAIKWLEKLAQGEVSLQISLVDGPAPAPSSSSVEMVSAPRLNSRDSLRDY